MDVCEACCEEFVGFVSRGARFGAGLGQLGVRAASRASSGVSGHCFLIARVYLSEM